MASLAVVVGCGGSNKPERLTTAQVVDLARPATVELWGKIGESVFGGTGVVFDAKKGLIATNQHVVDGLTGLQAKVGDALPAIPVQVVGQSPCDDLAVVKLTRIPPGLKSLSFGNSDTVKNGAHVTALGYPASFQRPLQQSVSSTDGTVSNPRVIGNEISIELPKYPALIQHQAPINHGNSGGPLLDDFGKVVGINTLSSAPIGNQGQYYAISSNQVKSVLPALQRGESPSYLGWRLVPLGVLDPRALASDLSASYGSSSEWQSFAKSVVEEVKGLYVVDSALGSPAREADVLPGDLLKEINNTPVTTIPEVCKILQSAAPGETLEIDTEILTDSENVNHIFNPYTDELKVPTAK